MGIDSDRQTSSALAGHTCEHYRIDLGPIVAAMSLGHGDDLDAKGEGHLYVEGRGFKILNQQIQTLFVVLVIYPNE